MTKEEYMAQLRSELAGRVSASQANDTLRYYEQYIRDGLAAGKREEDILQELGPARLIVKSMEDARDAKQQRIEEEEREEERSRHQEEKKQQRKISLLSMLLDRKFRWIFVLLGILLLLVIVVLLIVAVVYLAWYLFPVILVILLFLVFLRIFLGRNRS